MFARASGNMSERRTHAAAAVGNPEFSEVLKNISTLCHKKTQSRKTGQRVSDTTTSPVSNDFQSPRHRGSRYSGINHGDSPGEVSQDIFWDSTSPTQAGTGPRNIRVVEISDIVNRIAPKNMKPEGKVCPLLQWISDSAVPCTPEIPKPRVKKRSSRQSSVDDLVKLARQFDENMQQDEESSERLKEDNNILNERVNTCEAELADASFRSQVEGLKCPSSSDQVEAELHALFDSSTQRVSGNLSEASACSQETKDPPATSADRLGSAAPPAEQKGTCMNNANSCYDFDDDWENDDLLNDSFVLALTQNANEQLDAKPKTTFHCDTKTNPAQFSSVCKPTANPDSARRPADSQCKRSCSALQELGPKPKTSNRSTFKLEPNPQFQPKMADNVSEFSYTEIQPKSDAAHQNSASTKTRSGLKPDKNNKDRAGCVKDSFVKDVSSSLWEDWDDDALLYQVCDGVEKVSNGQHQQVSPSNCQIKQNLATDRETKRSEVLQINTAGANTPSAFVCSNSLPGSNSDAVSYRGWNIPMKSANSKSGMSQSFPGSHISLGTFNHCGGSSGTFPAGNTNVDINPVMTRATQNSTSQNTAFKRHVSDSAVTSNKVFVTNQMAGRCSAAEIERKKQEALARRRLRLQNGSKPP